jgi:hypothetical protein
MLIMRVPGERRAGGVGFILRRTLRYPLLRAAEKGVMYGVPRDSSVMRAPVAPAVVAAGKRGAVSALVEPSLYPRRRGLRTERLSQQGCRHRQPISDRSRNRRRRGPAF